ncbi:hypothetical protein DPMN_161882 [Dreissena polymorpha]|uniref:DDE Tnp4 domain-containing protein n=1 Tax=Dreissena polymorpha TaxID=45954 RepID=A0A9D4EU02_DREPO|nr:hypothetical protein DPMN_161882 [Dreissena polymorpha]
MFFLNRSSLLNLLTAVREYCVCSKSKRLSFDDLTTFSEEDLLNLTGISVSNFLALLKAVELSIRNTPARTARTVATTIGIFLFKLKSGLSNKVLSTLFDVSKSSVRRAIQTSRKVLMTDFVPFNLGFSHISREDVINKHTRNLAQLLFTENKEQVILVLDGTYIYIQKSGNFQFQRQTYSMHKGRPLVKPMVIVTTSGYFISVIGPYLANSKNNDASILHHIIKINIEEIKNWVKENDIFVVDRGFRDATSLLEELGIHAQMPSFLPRGSNNYQLIWQTLHG